MTGSQAGIITTGSHFDARVVGVRPGRIESALDAGEVVVVAGYQGVSQAGEITTLGRGGSDTSAVALAAALSARRCEIYSDVDGVYSADPRRVEGARHLPLVGYRFVYELACAGAKVLNPRAVELAAEGRIDLRARSTFDESPRPRETRVTFDEACPQNRAVVEQPEVVTARSKAASREQVFEAARRADFTLLDLRETAAGRWQAWVRLDAVRRRLLGRLEAEGFEVCGGYSLVSLVDTELGNAPRAAQALALLPKSATLVARDAGRLSVMLPSHEAPELVRTWHEQLVASGNLRHSA